MGAVVVLVGGTGVIRMGVRVGRGRGAMVVVVAVRVIMAVNVPRIFVRCRRIAQWGMATIVRAGGGVVLIRYWAGHGQL